MSFPNGRKGARDSIEGGKPLIGCAGWSIPRDEKPYFPGSGSHLERYAGCFSGVEINSSFYRPHRVSTYVRWAASVPAGFRFSVKIPKAITHTARLKDCSGLLAGFLAEASGLGGKLGCLLVQLPPGLAFDPETALGFVQELRASTGIDIAFEPRHETWFEPSVGTLLERFRIARVAADPALVPAAAEPGGWHGLNYYRLHGSPEMYKSAYPQDYLRNLADRLTSPASAGAVWCIFDNTALGFAMPNARQLLRELET